MFNSTITWSSIIKISGSYRIWEVSTFPRLTWASSGERQVLLNVFSMTFAFSDSVNARSSFDRSSAAIVSEFFLSRCVRVIGFGVFTDIPCSVKLKQVLLFSLECLRLIAPSSIAFVYLMGATRFVSCAFPLSIY